MGAEQDKSWLCNLSTEYKERFYTPFRKSGLFTMSFILLLTIGFIGFWFSVYDSIVNDGIYQSSNNKSVAGSVISLVIVSCIDVMLSLFKKNKSEKQKGIDIRYAEYIYSIVVFGLALIALSISVIKFADTIYGNVACVIAFVGAVILWIQVNATNPAYFEEPDLAPDNVKPKLPAKQKDTPYTT